MISESQTDKSPYPDIAGDSQSVAVIGLGALFPGGQPGPAGYWSLVKNGRDAITDIPGDHFRAEDYYDPDPKARDRIYCRRGAFIPSVPFSPLKYGITPKDLETIDTTQLLSLVIADEALADAGYPAEAFAHDRTAIILGVTGALKMVVSLGSRLVHPQLRRSLEECGLDEATIEKALARFSEKFPPWRESSFPGLLGNVTAGRVANRLDLGGPNMVVDAACASSLAAIGQALTALRSRKADLVVSGGIDTFSDPFMFSCFSKTPALSPTGEVRAFDKKGDGTLLGEGVGVVVLKRLADAVRDGDRIYATIEGVGGSSDGKGTAIFAPSPAGQKRAIEAAYLEAGWSPGEVELVEAHGTGTAVGDEVELTALSGFFGGPGGAPDGPWAALGSVKSQIGHSKGAAGVAGLIKAVLALHHKVLPPTIKVTEPLEPLSQGNFPLYLNDRARPWLSAPGRARKASVSSFGFGGSNFHCLLAEAPGPKPADPLERLLVPISADDPAAAVIKISRLAQLEPGDDLASGICALGREFAAAFKPRDEHRLVFTGMAGDVLAEAKSVLATLQKAQEPRGEGRFYRGQGAPSPEPLVIRFPGAPGPDWPKGAARALGQALMELAMAFPGPLALLDAAEGLRRERGLAGQNLGLILSPPALAPQTFGEKLARAIEAPAMGRLVYCLAQLTLADLARAFALPVSECRAEGLGHLASLHWANKVSAREAMAIALDLDLAGTGREGELLARLAPALTGESPGDFLAKLLEAPGPLPGAEAQEGGSIDLPAPVPAWLTLRASGLAYPFSPIEPMASFAGTLAALAAKGLAVDFGAWPAWPERRPAEAGYSVMVGGANLFREPDQIPAPAKPVPARIPPRLPDGFDERVGALLANQRQGLSMLEELSQTLAGPGSRPEPRPQPRPFAAPKAVAPRVSPGNGKSNGSGLPARAEAPRALAHAAGPGAGVWDRLAAVVSQETGYPADSLTMDMALENDLGLDSIKKVELMSALSELFPGLAEAGPGAGQPTTLGDLCALCQAASPAAAPGPVLGQGGAREALFEILARETGYPADSLSLDMALENDLGLDSIKKVELMSALSESFPGADPATLSQAKSLRHILDALSQGEGAGEGPVEPATDGQGRSVLEIVATETGYPVDSLSPDMDLETDLGLDSIKKVEILSLLTEGLAAPPDPGALAKAKTLADWQAFFGGAAVKPAPAQPKPSYGGNGGGNGRDAGFVAPGPPLSGKEILDRVLGTGGKDLPSLWQVVPEPFATAGHGTCLWPPSGLVRLVGSDPLSRSLEKELSGLGYEVERRPWSYDFGRWRDDGLRPRILFLVWPGPDRDPGLITQALSALENAGERAESIVGLSFLGGFFGFPRPGGIPGMPGNSISGSLVGLLKCAAREWPQVTVRALDLPLALFHSPTPGWISAILETATCQGPVELGLPKDDRVYNLTLQPYYPTISTDPLLGPLDTVVVTGGGRGVTAATMLALARLYRPRLVILGRTPLPPPEPDWLAALSTQREIMEALFNLSGRSASPKELEARAALILSSRELTGNLKALADTGAQVEYVSGDFTSPAFIEETARKIRARFGPIKGFIHGAGILADHPIIGKKQSDFAKVYATKTLLASHLLESFQPEPLRLMVFFSSTTARFGRQGQCDYAAGNEVLNKTAWEMAMLHPNCRVLALNWGPWAGGMVSDSLAGQFKSQGLGLIGLKEGAETFLRLIRTPVGGPAEVVVLGQGTSLDILSG
ncbi:MAG: SDR family NAD(P)-dependent oxidoreductase [Deltaproteobacteria bacterium]|jgi:3-oxoacyl-(acyl-carrier-protein) synthase/acyl carrier protein/NAD(P)-dependent dehydrogenase (short-subunit alcohol dehydrogenase family)|nr:SDR family NAD(P)-dependent oxidoreductase [Deltaproteobacteria bacterium]